ncbi:SNF2 family domain-containing protein [Colletotrichum higginsianum]|nr:SNF2 family domain-containing protein [Colletotrichum higginsianum]
MAATPAPRKSASRIEIQLPTAAGLRSERALRRSQYSMAPIKRKRSDNGDGDDDDDEEYSDNDRDASVARRLQKEENRRGSKTARLSDADLARRLQEEEYDMDEVNAPTASQQGRRSVTSAKALATDSEDDMSEDMSFAARTKPSGQGRSRLVKKKNISFAQPPTKKQKDLSFASDDEDELVGSMDEDDDFDLSSEKDDSDYDFDDNPKTSTSKGKNPVRETRSTASSSAQPPATSGPSRRDGQRQREEEDILEGQDDDLSSLSSYVTNVTDDASAAAAASTASDSDGRLQNAVRSPVVDAPFNVALGGEVSSSVTDWNSSTLSF